MMKKALLASASVALAVVASTASADGPGWSGPKQVTRVVIASNGGVNVRFEPAMAGCVSQSGYGERYASIYPDHPGLKAMLAVLLTAQSTGRP